MRRLAMALCLAAMTAGCGGIQGTFDEMKPYTRHAHSPAEIELYMGHDLPRRPVRIVGTINTDWPWKGIQADQQEVFRALRETAAKNGLDGVLNIDCAGVGYVGPGLCSGSGFVYAD